MRLQSLAVRNFRNLTKLDLPLEGKSAFLIGENGCGKSTVLASIALALGFDRRVWRADFADLDRAIVIQATLDNLTPEEAGELSGVVEFGDQPTLVVGLRATWDADAEEVEVEHGYPSREWKRSKPDERAAIGLWVLPADRDIGRMLDFGIRRNVMGTILTRAGIDEELQEAARLLAEANGELGSAEEIGKLLASAQARMGKVLPAQPDRQLSIENTAATPRELLGQLELHVGLKGKPIAVRQQSSGIAQAVGFAFLTELVASRPGSIVLVDEPELSLHPQAQRALTRLIESLEVQCVLATHSSNLLDRADPRKVLRLIPTGTGTEIASPSKITDAEARKLTRFTNPQTAEAFFARSAVLVEGYSDKLALEAVAERLGRNLDNEGISIVSLDGADTFETFLRLLGNDGFRLRLKGLCDENKEKGWRRALKNMGYGDIADRATMEKLGFLVAVRDLEDELIRALGSKVVLEVIASEGDEGSWVTFTKQPSQPGGTLEDQLRAFLQSSDRKVRYTPLLVDKLPNAAIPQKLIEVLDLG
jgi:predicted ATPase